MIRINLLPVRQEYKRQYGKQQLLLGVLLLGVEIAVLYAIHQGDRAELEEVQGLARGVETEVQALQTQSAEVNRLNDQKQQLEDLAGVLEDLEADRAGPVQVLDELKLMLNPPANDLQRVAQQLMQWDTSWDPTQVWITSFLEEDGAVEIVGKARSNDDVAEFTVRLANSPYFSDVLLNSTRAATQTGLGAVFEFDLSARVNYELAAGEEG